jgi:hypothetical protein
MSIKDDAGVETKDHQAPDDTGVEKKPESSVQEPDWKAIAEKERAEKENYKKGLAQKRQFLKGQPIDEIEPENDDDKPLTRKDIRSVLQEEIVPVLTSNKEDQILTSKITDPAKREAVKAILDNSIRRTGTSEEAISSDIDKALAIADSHRIRVVNEELKRKIENKPLDKSSEGGSNEKDIEVDKIDPQIRARLEERARFLKVDPKKFVEQYIQNRKKTTTVG